jgi:geranylgeranyl reductase family protein
MDYDAVIIGGGPVGAVTAGKLVKAGFNIAVLEEHPRPGMPVQCAGLVTTKIEDFVKLDNCKLNSVQGAHIHSPSGHKLVLDTGRPKAYVIDRSRFDSDLLDDAAGFGADLRLGTKVTGVSRKGGISGEGSLEISASTKEGPISLTTPLVIGSDGANSKIRELFEFQQPRILLKGIGQEFEYSNMSKDFVQIFSGNEIAPGFFAWAIPTESTVRVGLCVMNNEGRLQDYFQNFLKLCRKQGLVPDAKPISSITGTIPLGALSQTTTDNVMLVGDAAAQVKPTSGGGLYPGIKGALLCAETAQAALEDGKYGAEELGQYHKGWQKQFGSELEKGLRLHRAFMQLSDDKLEEAFDILDKPEILEVISNKGDIESPFALAKLLFKKAPKLIKFAGPYFRSAFK